MRAGARFVLEVLLTDADVEGLCWRSPREIAAITPRSAKRPRYSLATVLRSLRELDEAGIVSTRRIAPGERYPRREGKGAKARAIWGQGPSTQSGGRVFVVNLDTFQNGAARRPPPPPESHDRPITYDRGTPITHDRPSDRPSDPSRNKKDPAAAPLSADAPAAPPETLVRAPERAGPRTMASETPSARALRAGTLQTIAAAFGHGSAGRARGDGGGKEQRASQVPLLSPAELKARRDERAEALRRDVDAHLGPQWRPRR